MQDFPLLLRTFMFTELFLCSGRGQITILKVRRVRIVSLFREEVAILLSLSRDDENVLDVLRPRIPPDVISQAFSYNRMVPKTFFFRANARKNAIAWAGCNRSVAIPLDDRPNMRHERPRDWQKPQSAGPLTQDEHNHLMSTLSDYVRLAWAFAVTLPRVDRSFRQSRPVVQYLVQ